VSRRGREQEKGRKEEKRGSQRQRTREEKQGYQVNAGILSFFNMHELPSLGIEVEQHRPEFDFLHFFLFVNFEKVSGRF
jgi:hypothetical protein